MQDKERAAVAREFRVREASIMQLEALGIDDYTVKVLLDLRNDAELASDTDSGFEGILPPIREIANTYLIFGGDGDGLGKVQSTIALYRAEVEAQLPPDVSAPTHYQEARKIVTEGYQRALFTEILGTHILSNYLHLDVESSVIDNPLIMAMTIRAVGASSIASADVILDQVVAGRDRVDAEIEIGAIIEAALKLPDEDIFLRTPRNDLVVLSKSDILLQFARYRSGDEVFLAAAKAAISRNTDPYRSATRKLALYNISGDPADLHDAGTTAFVHAYAMLAKPMTRAERYSINTKRNIAQLLNVLQVVIVEAAEGRPVNPQGVEINMLRALIDRTDQLVDRPAWVPQARKNIAALTNDDNDIDAYRAVDPTGYLDTYVVTGARPLEPILEERLRDLTEALGGEYANLERATQAAVDLVELVSKFNDTTAKETVLTLDLSGFERSRASRIRNALCEALIQHGDLEAATEVARRMTNKDRRRQYLAQIESLRQP